MPRRKANRDDALRSLYRRNVRAVYAYLSYSVSRDVAEDLTSATFERAVRAYDRFDSSMATERTWLIAIARNALTDHFRRQRHRRTISTDEHPLLLDRLVASDDPLASSVSMASLVDWLKALGPRQQEVLALRFGADLSAREIAEHLGISEQNVHQISSRALRALRRSVEVVDPITDIRLPDE